MSHGEHCQGSYYTRSSSLSKEGYSYLVKNENLAADEFNFLNQDKCLLKCRLCIHFSEIANKSSLMEENDKENEKE